MIDTTGELSVGRDWARSLALPALCIAVSVVFWFGMTMQVDSFFERRFQSQSWLVFPLIAPFTLWVGYRLVWPVGALIRMTPDGFQDRRMNGTVIPWTEIRNAVRKGEFVYLTLKRTFARSYRFSPSQRILKATRKNAGPTHLLIAHWCVAATGDELLEAIQAYRRAHAPEGRA